MRTRQYTDVQDNYAPSGKEVIAVYGGMFGLAILILVLRLS
ncbi:MAG TPA: hypothetical protein VGG13_04160 [Candidatus Saccharimonadales bacterium]|jgi:hypothetical protein